jgi:hypothetical protein
VTLGDIAERVAIRILTRTDDDLRDEAVNSCADAYRALCSEIPFEALQATSSAISTVADQVSYDLGALITDTIAGIISIRYTNATGAGRRLTSSDPRIYDSLGTVTAGYPYSFARSTGSNIDLNPPPLTADDTFQVRYWKMPTISATETSNHTIEIADEWHELIMWETLYRLYYYLEQPEKALALMTPSFMPRSGSTKKTRSMELGMIPRLKNEALQTQREREYADKDFSINPVQRRYTHVRGR